MLSNETIQNISSSMRNTTKSGFIQRARSQSPPAAVGKKHAPCSSQFQLPKTQKVIDDLQSLKYNKSSPASQNDQPSENMRSLKTSSTPKLVSCSVQKGDKEYMNLRSYYWEVDLSFILCEYCFALNS
jgi:hypothetical protein